MQSRLATAKYRAGLAVRSRAKQRGKRDNRRIPNYVSPKNRNNNVRVSHDRTNNPPLAYYILMTDRAASGVAKGYDTRVKFGRGPERDRPRGRTAERSEKGPDRSGTGGFSLNYRTYATSARVNHSTMPSDGRSSGSLLFSPSLHPFALQSFVPGIPACAGTEAGHRKGSVRRLYPFLRHRRIRKSVKHIARERQTNANERGDKGTTGPGYFCNFVARNGVSTSKLRLLPKKKVFLANPSNV